MSIFSARLASSVARNLPKAANQVPHRIPAIKSPDEELAKKCNT